MRSFFSLVWHKHAHIKNEHRQSGSKSTFVMYLWIMIYACHHNPIYYQESKAGFLTWSRGNFRLPSIAYVFSEGWCQFWHFILQNIRDIYLASGCAPFSANCYTAAYLICVQWELAVIIRSYPSLHCHSQNKAPCYTNVSDSTYQP